MARLSPALAALNPQRLLWHRPRGGRKWRLFGVYDDIRAALEVLLREQARVGGSWKALPVGLDPRAADKEDDDPPTAVVTVTRFSRAAERPSRVTRSVTRSATSTARPFSSSAPAAVSRVRGRGAGFGDRLGKCLASIWLIASNACHSSP
jgi:hypothetical protein